MSYPNRSGFSNEPGASEAEETLRLIARLPVPEGLEDRVQAGLLVARGNGGQSARVLAWPAASPLAGGWLRAAAAAAIVFVVAGGGWGIYTRVQPGVPAPGVGGPRIAGPGEFSGSQARRRPQTLEGPVVVNPPVDLKRKAKATAGSDAVSKTKSKTARKAASQPPAPADK